MPPGSPRRRSRPPRPRGRTTGNQVQQGWSGWFTPLDSFSCRAVQGGPIRTRPPAPTRTKTSRAVCVFLLLQQNLAGFLVGEDLSLHPLERVVDRLRVTA